MAKKKSLLVEWLVVAKSSNLNSFGLRQYVLVNRQGDAYKALHGDSAGYAQNQVLKVAGAEFFKLGFECAEQISEKMPLKALSDAWALAGEPAPEVEPKKNAVAAPDVTEIMAYENGEMDQETLIEFFQRLISSGLAWQLQGCYGRQAARLIEAGLCHK
jgi:hypothetical protein